MEGGTPRCVRTSRRSVLRRGVQQSYRSGASDATGCRRGGRQGGCWRLPARRVPMGPAAWMLQEVFAIKGLPGALCTACVSREFTRARPPWRSMQRWTVPQPSLNPAWLVNGAGPQWRHPWAPRPAPDVPHRGPGEEPAWRIRTRVAPRPRSDAPALGIRRSSPQALELRRPDDFHPQTSPSERIARTGADASRPLSGRRLARRLRMRGEARGRHYPITGVSNCVADPSFSQRRS